MTTLDAWIIVIYLIGIVLLGIFISKKAGKDLKNYFLSGNRVPWYWLSVSNASSMFDITGTMWVVYVMVVYGMKGILLQWQLPIFNQIFMMVYLAVWIRRSNALTGAEWMDTRFSRRGGEFARLSVTLFAFISVIGFLTYAFQGIGKFAATFLPWDFSPDTYAILFMSVTAIYVIAGGMYSVVFTDVIQFFLLGAAGIALGIIAMHRINPGEIAQLVPQGWDTLRFGARLGIDWSESLPSAQQRIMTDGWEFFSIILMGLLFKGFLVSSAGPSPGYDMQRVLATRNPRESALMSGMVTVSLIPRWIMIAGITLMAVKFFIPEMVTMGTDVDYEQILPFVIRHFLPAGLMGIILAGLLAGFMSTFDSTVNSGAAYLVNDVYKRYINPKASDQKLVYISYGASLLLVLLGIVFGLMAESINEAMMWIVSGLWGGYAAPNMLKWYWWRMNGFGFFWGMASGMAAALCLPLLIPGLHPLVTFPIVFGLSLAGTIAGSLLTPKEPDEILCNFYRTVRPWGFWKPVKEKVQLETPGLKPSSFRRDMMSICIGIVWQLSLAAVPVYLVMKYWGPMLIWFVVALMTTGLLKVVWYDKLEKNSSGI
jgi:Na+/proline symporter